MNTEQSNYLIISGLVLNTLGSVILAFSINRTTTMLNTSIRAIEHFMDTYAAGGDILIFTGLDKQREKALKNSSIKTTCGLIFIMLGFILQLTPIILSFYSKNLK